MSHDSCPCQDAVGRTRLAQREVGHGEHVVHRGRRSGEGVQGLVETAVNDEEFDPVLTEAHERLHNVGFSPLIVLAIIQVIMSLVQLCIPKTGTVAQIPVTMLGRIRLGRALRQAGIDDPEAVPKVLQAFDGVSEAQISQFVEASRRLGDGL